jgi:hypothetical protein
MRLKDPLNGIANANILGLKQSGFSGVIVATAGDLKNGTNTSNAMAGALMD